MTAAYNGGSHIETWPSAKEDNMTQQWFFALHCVIYLPLQRHGGRWDNTEDRIVS